MSAYQFVITHAGRAAIVNAANTGTDAVIISQIAVGSAYAAATAARTGLTNEVTRITAVGGGVVSADTIHITGVDASDAEYEAREIGLYSDGGVLVALYAQASPILTKAASTKATIGCDLMLTSLPAGSVTVGGISFSNPPATETVQGVAEIATEAETLAGTDDQRIVTPKKLFKAVATAVRRGLVRLATEAEVLAGSDAESAVTPATLAARSATTDRRGLIEIATDAEAGAGTDDTRALTPKHVALIRGQVLQALYPVGEIYITHRDGDPFGLLGFGTWARYGAGRTLVGYNAADADFNALDKTGGAKAVALSVSEIPGHVHTVDPPSATTTAAGGHRHQLEAAGGTLYVDEAGTGGTVNGQDVDKQGVNPRPIIQTTAAGDHTHAVDIAPFNSGSAGGGQAHNNLQPYITVFMWRRVA